jgi:hypothetical protein
MINLIETVEDRNAQKVLQLQSGDLRDRHYPRRDMCFVAVDLEKKETQKISYIRRKTVT